MEYPFKELQPLDEATARDGYYKDWTHIDADTFHQISELVKFIREKGYGADTREAIAQALERVYHDAAMSDNANMEVSMARGEFDTLGGRLDNTTAQLAQTPKRGEISVNDIDRNKGKLDQTYMSDEFLQQITGDTPVNAIPADNSLTTAKYVDGSVTNSKLSPRFFEKGSFNSGDLNNFWETGSYYVSTSNVLNKPDNIYTGILTVFNAYTGFTTQIFHDIQPTNKFYIRNLRFWNGVASMIGEWQEMGIDSYMTTNNKEWVV